MVLTVQPINLPKDLGVGREKSLPFRMAGLVAEVIGSARSNAAVYRKERIVIFTISVARDTFD